MKKILFTLLIGLGGLTASFAQTQISGYLDSDPTDGINSTAAIYTWSNAATACRTLIHDNKTDWYLPALEEIMLFNPAYGTGTGQAVPGCIGNNCNLVNNRRIWTRSPYGSNYVMWTVYSTDANHTWLNEGQTWNYGSGYVRCVR